MPPQYFIPIITLTYFTLHAKKVLMNRKAWIFAGNQSCNESRQEKTLNSFFCRIIFWCKEAQPKCVSYTKNPGVLCCCYVMALNVIAEINLVMSLMSNTRCKTFCSTTASVHSLPSLFHNVGTVKLYDAAFWTHQVFVVVMSQS